MSRAVRELAELLEALRVPGARLRAARPLLVVAAHPDDETIGATWVLRRAVARSVLFLTDGAPRDRSLWPVSAPRGREGYATLRAIEARCALAIVGVPADRIATLHAIDQEACRGLVELSCVLENILERSRPGVVVTHAYEGGHPDHDAAAFVVQAAVARIAPAARPAVVEMASYHRHRGALRTGRFLAQGPPQTERVLSSQEREDKAAMFSCYASQAPVLAAFGLERERYRRAPAYDFRVAPHGGLLHYETLGWPLDGAAWRQLAAQALARLDAPYADPGASIPSP